MVSSAVEKTNYAVPTGDFIRDWLDENSMSQAEFARRLNVSPKHVSLLLNGVAPLSQDIALKVESVTGIPARIWNSYEAVYRGDLARLAGEREWAAEFEKFSSLPLGELRKRGWLTADPADRAGVVGEILRFFRVADFSSWSKVWLVPQAAYRQSKVHASSTEAIATWLRLGEIKAEELSLAPYDREALTSAIPELRSLSRKSVGEWESELKSLASSVGVAVVFVPDIAGTRCYGATRWSHGNPIVQLSLRGKKDDQFWFTLFHELGHVLLHPRSAVFIDHENGVSARPEEEEADQFAVDTLIPPEKALDLPRGRNLAAVRRFADEVGVSPGIVLGRVHRETGDYGWGHSLKVTLKFAEERH